MDTEWLWLEIPK